MSVSNTNMTERGYTDASKAGQYERTKRPECSADTKLFFDDVYKLGTRGKKQQVDVLQYGRSMIEMLGVLAIVGVLSVGGIAGPSRVGGLCESISVREFDDVFR